MTEITEKDLQEVPLEDEYAAMLETQGEEATKAFYICNAFKYLHRQRRKGGVADIKKAKWCLEKYLEIDGNNGNGREEIDGKEDARAVFRRLRADKGDRGENSRVKRGEDNPYRQNGRIQPRVSLDKTEL